MDQIQAMLMQYSGTPAYLFFTFVIMGCGVGLPFNSDLVLISSGVLASLGFFDLKLLILLATIAILCGDSITFFVGRRWGKSVLSLKPISWVITPEKVELAEHYLNTKGTKFLFLVRFIPLIRTVLFFTAGSLQVRPRTFYIMNTAATFIYVPFILGTAYLASENIDQVIATFQKFQFALLIGVLCALAFFLLRTSRKRKALKSAQ